MNESERIWLEPECAGNERCWSSTTIDDCCEDGCGLPAIEYVRADIAADEIERLTRELAEAREKMRQLENEVTDLRGFARAVRLVVNGPGGAEEPKP